MQRKTVIRYSKFHVNMVLLPIDNVSAKNWNKINEYPAQMEPSAAAKDLNTEFTDK